MGVPGCKLSVPRTYIFAMLSVVKQSTVLSYEGEEGTPVRNAASMQKSYLCIKDCIKVICIKISSIKIALPKGNFAFDT